MREELRFRGDLVSAVVSRTADKWSASARSAAARPRRSPQGEGGFVSLTVELEDKPERCENQAAVGVDLGVRRLASLATLWGEETFEGPKPLRRELRKLRRLCRQLSRKRKGSKNREKARVKLARLHYRISCVRQDSLHKLTTYLTKNYGWIGIEDLNVKGMLANRRLARAIADMGFHEFRRQLEYKAALRGNHVAVADRWFASSKMCSGCGAIQESLSLGERQFQCATCGLEKDRDLNAAKNLLRTVSSTGPQACGEERSGFGVSRSETILCEAGTGA